MAKQGKRKSIFKRWWFWTGLAVLLIIIIAASSSGGGSKSPSTQAKGTSTTATSSKQSSNNHSSTSKKSKSAKKKTNKPKVKTWGPGTYQVGKDIKPGIYYNPNAGSYIARLKNLSGDMNSIIANANPMGAPWYIQVKSTDKAVKFSKKGWRKLDKSKHQIKTSFGSGIYLVGVDIKPGVYKLKGSASYWGRLKDVSGGLNSIIANGNPNGQTIVQVKSSDYAFEVQGSGTWTLQK